MILAVQYYSYKLSVTHPEVSNLRQKIPIESMLKATWRTVILTSRVRYIVSQTTIDKETVVMAQLLPPVCLPLTLTSRQVN